MAALETAAVERDTTGAGADVSQDGRVEIEQPASPQSLESSLALRQEAPLVEGEMVP